MFPAQSGSRFSGQFADGTVKYLRITNLDASANITLRIKQTDAEYFIILEPEDHYLLGNTKMDAHEDGDTALGTTESAADIDVISAKSSSGTIQIELFVACQD